MTDRVTPYDVLVHEKLVALQQHHEATLVECERLQGNVESLGHEVERLLALNERLRQSGFREAEKSERLQSAQVTALAKLRAAWACLKALLGVNDRGELMGEPTLWDSSVESNDALRAELQTEHDMRVDTDHALSRAESEIERLQAQIADLLNGTVDLNGTINALRAANERLDAFAHKLEEEARAATFAVERLRGFLKYVKGLAQDEDNLKLMDEIDDALSQT